MSPIATNSTHHDEMALLLESFQIFKRIIQRANKEQTAECAQILALSVAALCLKHGEVPTVIPLANERLGSTAEEEAKLLVSAFRILADTLSALMDEGAHDRTDAVH